MQWSSDLWIVESLGRTAPHGSAPVEESRADKQTRDSWPQQTSSWHRIIRTLKTTNCNGKLEQRKLNIGLQNFPFLGTNKTHTLFKKLTFCQSEFCPLYVLLLSRGEKLSVINLKFIGKRNDILTQKSKG